jgi:8-oxo-dGTP pyrophosphatase MutT (NUDIX family)
MHLIIIGSNRYYIKLAKLITWQWAKCFYINEEGINWEAKSIETMYHEFFNFYQKEIQIMGFICLWRSTIQNSIENIAWLVELIKKNHTELKAVQVLWPSYLWAKIFNHKWFTHKHLKKYNLDTPKTSSLNINNLENVFYPCIIKATSLSWWVGIKYVKTLKEAEKFITELKKWWVEDILYSEFINWFEATYTICRINSEIYIEMPISRKDETSIKMIHPDNKVKLCWFYWWNYEIFKKMKQIMKEYDIYWFFSLQTIFNNQENKRFIIETATRITWSTPIMIGSFKNSDFRDQIVAYYLWKWFYIWWELQKCIQYSSYIYNNNSLEYLKNLPCTIEVKYENLSEIKLSHIKESRIKYSFYYNWDNAIESNIEQILWNKNYFWNIHSIIQKLSQLPPIDNEWLVNNGSWWDNISWKFKLTWFIPNINLCTAVFWLIIINKKILLTRTKRWRELPGWHINNDESIKDTLKREILEETWYTIHSAFLWGIREIYMKEPMYDDNWILRYPFPHSYIPHFVWFANLQLKQELANDALDSELFDINDLPPMKSDILEIIYALYERYIT